MQWSCSSVPAQDTVSIALIKRKKKKDQGLDRTSTSPSSSSLSPSVFEKAQLRPSILVVKERHAFAR